MLDSKILAFNIELGNGSGSSNNNNNVNTSISTWGGGLLELRHTALSAIANTSISAAKTFLADSDPSAGSTFKQLLTSSLNLFSEIIEHCTTKQQAQSQSLVKQAVLLQALECCCIVTPIPALNLGSMLYTKCYENGRVPKSEIYVQSSFRLFNRSIAHGLEACGVAMLDFIDKIIVPPTSSSSLQQEKEKEEKQHQTCIEALDRDLTFFSRLEELALKDENTLSNARSPQVAERLLVSVLRRLCYDRRLFTNNNQSIIITNNNCYCREHE